MITRAMLKHWAVVTIAYIPNALAANILLTRILVNSVDQHLVRVLIIFCGVDLAIWFLLSRVFARKWLP